MQKELTPSKYAKERGLKISLAQAGRINRIQEYTPVGLYKLFNSPNDTDHKKFNSIVDDAQKFWDMIIKKRKEIK